MTLTNRHLDYEESQIVPTRYGSEQGTHRVYRVGNYGLSCLNAPSYHSFPYAWEVAVVSFDERGEFYSLRYDTPLTTDVEVFSNDAETNVFIESALDYFEKLEKQKSK